MSQWIHKDRTGHYQCRALNWNPGQTDFDICVGTSCMHWSPGNYLECADGWVIDEALDAEAYEGAYPYGRCGLSSK